MELLAQAGGGDPVLASLLEDVERMTLDELNALGRNQAWQSRAGGLFPPDGDALEEAVRNRMALLREEAEQEA